MTMIYMSLAYLALMALSLQHPVSLSLNLIAMASLAGLSLTMRLSSWLLFSLMLVFLGGMMVVFLYFSSLVSSEKFVSAKWGGTPVLAAIAVGSSWHLSSLAPNLRAVSVNYSDSNFYMNIILILYLLITLFGVVKLTQHFKGMLETRCF